MNIEIEIITEEKIVYLSHDGSSGCKYTFKDAADLKEIVGQYVADVYAESLWGE